MGDDIRLLEHDLFVLQNNEDTTAILIKEQAKLRQRIIEKKALWPKVREQFKTILQKKFNEEQEKKQ